MINVVCFFFFFQAEDGIRDIGVTGVQTCALPIFLEVVKGLDIEVIAALHDLNLAAMYCDKIYIMKNGNIVSYGKPEEVITKEMLRDVFEVDGDVYIHPKTNKINIIYFGVNY